MKIRKIGAWLGASILLAICVLGCTVSAVRTVDPVGGPGAARLTGYRQNQQTSPLFARRPVVLAAGDPNAPTNPEPLMGSQSQNPSPAQPAQPTLTLSFVGDILLASTVGDLIAREGPMAPWEGVAEVLKASDFTAGNLECSVGTSGEPTPGKTYTFRADPKSLEGLVDSGFDLVSLANNHSLDFGVTCLLETVENVRQAGIIPIGAGKDEKAARNGYILEKNGIRVGFLATTMVIPQGSWAATPTSPGLAVDYSDWSINIQNQITDVAAQTDIVCVLIHWGEERKTVPETWVKKMEGILKSAGADIVIGHHPHVLQGFNYDGKTLTAYSLGNFVFTTRPDIPACQIGAILNVTVSKDGIQEARVIPTKILWGRTVLLADAEKSNALAGLATLSRPFRCDIETTGSILPIQFTDMTGHWARFTVSRLHGIGAIEGYGDGTFRPELLLNKGEYAALLSRGIASKQEIESARLPESFSLCHDSHWAYPYLKFLAFRGAIPVSDPSWRPSEDCSREEVVLAAWKAAGSPFAEWARKDAFPELASKTLDSKNAFSWALASGIIRGYEDGTVRPERTVTRAEAAVILWRYLQVVEP